MSEPADRDGMFSDPRLMHVGLVGIAADDYISVVTCTLCGALVADTEAHRRMHATTVTRGGEIRAQQFGEY